MTDTKTKEGSSSPSRRPRDDEHRSFWLVSLFQSLARFIREIVAEMRKVLWPSRQELITYTIVVIDLRGGHGVDRRRPRHRVRQDGLRGSSADLDRRDTTIGRCRVREVLKEEMSE